MAEVATPQKSAWNKSKLFGLSGHKGILLAVAVILVLDHTAGGEAAFNVSLELQEDCSNQLTLICRHDAVPTDPNWIHNGTVEGGEHRTDAFHEPVLPFQNSTEHRVTVTGVDYLRVLNGYVFQCAYSIGSTPTKSNAVQYSFVPIDYQPVLSLVSYRPDFSERLSTFTYSFQESCSLYPRCTSYFSVEHTGSPLSVVNTTSSGCTVEYTISNLERCRNYHSTATAVFGNRKGNSVVVGDSVMLSPAEFTIISINIGPDHDLINVTYEQNEPDCPGYPTEWYTVDIDGVQVANMTADEFQSLTTNRTNGSVTLSLPLTQRLSEEAVTVNMTKFNTVPTNMSDDVGNIVTEMVTWGTSAVFVSGSEEIALVPGTYSVTVTVSNQHGDTTSVSQVNTVPVADNTPLIIGLVVAAVILVLLLIVVVFIIVLIYMKRKDTKGKYKMEKKEPVNGDEDLKMMGAHSEDALAPQYEDPDTLSRKPPPAVTYKKAEEAVDAQPNPSGVVYADLDFSRQQMGKRKTVEKKPEPEVTIYSEVRPMTPQERQQMRDREDGDGERPHSPTTIM